MRHALTALPSPCPFALAQDPATVGAMAGR